MRLRFKPTREQRAALKVHLSRILQPAVAQDLLRTSLPRHVEPAGVTCVAHSVHVDRFVVRAVVRSRTGEEHAYALKTYVDDFGGQVWAYAQILATRPQLDRDGVCRPVRYLPEERTLVFPWVSGPSLADVADHRTPQLLQRAAGLAAALHRSGVVPEAPTTAETTVNETLARCDRLCARWPAMAPLVMPLVAKMRAAAHSLDATDPVPVHGDLWAGQLVWTGERLVLLDLDAFGYADPAYDAGYFLAQLERKGLSDPARSAQTPGWLAAFWDAYLAEVPWVSPRNVSFYRGVTLMRKLYTVCRSEPTESRALVPRLAARASEALEDTSSWAPAP